MPRASRAESPPNPAKKSARTSISNRSAGCALVCSEDSTSASSHENTAVSSFMSSSDADDTNSRPARREVPDEGQENTDEEDIPATQRRRRGR
jgi:hypothetical protein